MQQDNRVFSRQNARELTMEETAHVSGGFFTAAPCSAPSKQFPNGDGPIADCPA